MICTFYCIYGGNNVFLFAYTDDIVNLSCTFLGSKRTFSKLQHQYQQIGLNFNVDKTVTMALNLKGNSYMQLEHSKTSILLSDSLIHLGIPIGRSIKETIKPVT